METDPVDTFNKLAAFLGVDDFVEDYYTEGKLIGAVATPGFDDPVPPAEGGKPSKRFVRITIADINSDIVHETRVHSVVIDTSTLSPGIAARLSAHTYVKKSAMSTWLTGNDEGLTVPIPGIGRFENALLSLLFQFTADNDARFFPPTCEGAYENAKVREVEDVVFVYVMVM